MGATAIASIFRAPQRPARCDARPGRCPQVPASEATVTVQARLPTRTPTDDGDPVHHERVVTDLVTRARNGQRPLPGTWAGALSASAWT